MTDKPRVRVAAWSSARTADSFQNFAARIGLGTNNLQSGATYGFNPVSRNRQLLEWMYGGSWIVGKAVDAVAEDMTRAGVEFKSPKLKPEENERLQTSMKDLAIWEGLEETIKWSRLYGGAVAVMLIEGQKLNTPLRIRTVAKDQFKGLAVLDRWMINPSMNHLVAQYGPDLGEPMFYDVVAAGLPLSGQTIHYSRLVRLDGIPQPYWRKIAENSWGLSVIEPLYDRLVAFDSTTNGAAQLVHKAHLRTLKVKNLREIIAAGGKAFEGLAKQIDNIRLFQTNEGMTLVDDTDTFETHQYSFTGLDDLLLQFGQQLSGAVDIPLVRLFGQSPAGLNSTGESDIRNYYDGISARQNARLRRPMNRLLRVAHQSELGRPVDEGFDFGFVPLWQLSEKEKAEIAASTTTAVTGAYDSGVIGRGVALKELRQSADVTGVYSNITDEEISEAEEEGPPTAAGELGLGEEEDDGGASSEGEPGKPGAPAGARAKDAAASFALHGLPIVIESPKGSMRAGKGWSCTMAAHYGYIQGTWSAEGRAEEMDCFVGPRMDSRTVFVIDQIDPETGAFDEHKCMLGYASAADAIRDYIASYSDRGFHRIGDVTDLDIEGFKAWLQDGSLDRPFATRDSGDWNEEDHPRRSDGKFGRGGGGTSLSGGRAEQPKPYFSQEKLSHLPHPKEVRSPARTWAEAEGMGRVGRTQFKSMLDQVAKRMRLSSDLATPEDLTGSRLSDGKSYLFLGPNKSQKRATAKVESDYDGDWTKLKDMVRATIAVEKVGDVRKVVDELERAGVKLAARPKDNISNVKPEGYRDLNMLVRLPNGMLAELQVNVKAMVEAKTAAHGDYEACQVLERRNGGGPPDATWPRKDRQEWERLAAKQRAVYDPAWKKAGGET